jgi:hypothetical protein
MTAQQRKPGRGCLFYTGIALGLSVVVLIIASYLGYRWAKSEIDQFTDNQPMPVPTVQMPQAELDALRTRIKNFAEAVEQNQPTDPLAFTADEANALIAATPELVTVRGHLHFDFQGSNVLAQFSVPAEDLGLRPLKGRYVNASGTFRVALTNGLLNVNAQSLSAKGAPFADTFLNRIKPQNFAYKLDQDPQAKSVLGKLEDVRVADDKLILVPKSSR